LAGIRRLIYVGAVRRQPFLPFGIGGVPLSVSGELNSGDGMQASEVSLVFVTVW